MNLQKFTSRISRDYYLSRRTCYSAILIACLVSQFDFGSSYVHSLRNTSDTEVIGAAEPGARTGKFLFDTLFGIEETAYNSDDEEPAANTNTLKSCDCGE